jgi:hypothetical protein
MRNSTKEGDSADMQSSSRFQRTILSGLVFSPAGYDRWFDPDRAQEKSVYECVAVTMCLPQ